VPDEVAFLTSERTSFITGGIVVVDGGMRRAATCATLGGRCRKGS